MKKTHYDLMKETAELKAKLDKADWELLWEPDSDYEDKAYETEIEGEIYYKVVYADGSVCFTDDFALVLGETD